MTILKHTVFERKHKSGKRNQVALLFTLVSVAYEFRRWKRTAFLTDLSGFFSVKHLHVYSLRNLQTH